jgi:prevent-host-death family protein
MGTTKKPPLPRTAGVREAKARLSQLLDDVRRGREWTITDRGEPVARLVPVSSESLPLHVRLRRLEQQGLLEPSSGQPRRVPPPLPLKKGLARNILDSDRDR